jgi:hypothetical protein
VPVELITGLPARKTPREAAQFMETQQARENTGRHKRFFFSAISAISAISALFVCDQAVASVPKLAADLF